MHGEGFGIRDVTLNNQYGISVAVGCNGVLDLAESIAGIMICGIQWATDTLEERSQGTDSEKNWPAFEVDWL